MPNKLTLIHSNKYSSAKLPERVLLGITFTRLIDKSLYMKRISEYSVRSFCNLKRI